MGIGRFIRKAPKRVLIVARRPAALFDSVALSQLSTLEPLLNGSRVAVIGNAQSIFHRRDGREIDDYDVIVRMNHGVITSPQHQGSRTDVLCVASAMTITELRSRFGSPVVVHTSAHRTRMKLSVVYGYPKLFFTPRKLWRDLREQLHHPPLDRLDHIGVSFSLLCTTTDRTFRVRLDENKNFLS